MIRPISNCHWCFYWESFIKWYFLVFHERLFCMKLVLVKLWDLWWSLPRMIWGTIIWQPLLCRVSHCLLIWVWLFFVKIFVDIFIHVYLIYWDRMTHMSSISRFLKPLLWRRDFRFRSPSWITYFPLPIRFVISGSAILNDVIRDGGARNDVCRTSRLLCRSLNVLWMSAPPLSHLDFGKGSQMIQRRCPSPKPRPADVWFTFTFAWRLESFWSLASPSHYQKGWVSCPLATAGRSISLRKHLLYCPSICLFVRPERRPRSNSLRI